MSCENSKDFLENDAESEMKMAVVKGVNFEDDTYTFDLIAGYKDKDDVLHKDFELREMTGKDEEAIHKADVKVNGSKVASVLLSRCTLRIGELTPKSVGSRQKWEEIIKSLYTGDQDFMLMKLREISVGKEVELHHVCPSCDAKLDTLMETEELEVIPFSGIRDLDFELPKGHKDRRGVVHRRGKMRLPVGLDREILTPLALKNQARAEIVMLTRLCKFDDGAYIDEDVIGSLSIRDISYLQKLLQENYFGINLSVEITCDSCGETFKGSLNTLTNFM